MAVVFQELGALNCCIEPFLTFFEAIVQHGEHPHFPALKPDEFVSVIDASVPVQAGEISAELLVLGFFKPERKDIVEQFASVAFCQLFEIVH